MNTFGDFLYELRKEKRLTQAELAERLGVTNKAVSKWETGEAMPETNLLLPLAEIFGVTVDELLNGRREEKSKEKPEADGGADRTNGRCEPDSISGHLFTRGKDDEPETPLDKIRSAICATLVLSAIAVYLLFGVITGKWNPYWLISATGALSSAIAGIIFELCNRQKRDAKRENGKNPYTDAACGILMISCVIIYLYLGVFTNLWHPCWIILAVGGLCCGIVGAIGNCMISKKK